MATDLVQRVIRSVKGREIKSTDSALILGAALGLGMISIITFRVAEGFVFSVAAMAACGLVYSLFPT